MIDAMADGKKIRCLIIYPDEDIAVSSSEEHRYLWMNILQAPIDIILLDGLNPFARSHLPEIGNIRYLYIRGGLEKEDLPFLNSLTNVTAIGVEDIVITPGKGMSNAEAISAIKPAIGTAPELECCIDIQPAEIEVVPTEHAPVTSWFHVWEPLQDVSKIEREKRLLLESLGPSLRENEE